MAKAPVVGAAHRSRRSRTSNLFRSDRVAAYIMLAPTIISFILFIGGPMLVGFGLTFFQWDALSSSKFVGLDNYRTLVHDPLVGTTLWNTFSFVVPDIALKLGLGIVLAALVDRFVVGPLKLGFRVVVFFPVIVSGVAVSLIWSWLLNTDLGLINYYLGQLNVSPIGWLDTSTTAMRSLVMVDVWRNIGFYFVVLTAWLQ